MHHYKLSSAGESSGLRTLYIAIVPSYKPTYRKCNKYQVTEESCKEGPGGESGNKGKETGSGRERGGK